jgi:hypothetical protein
MNLGRGDSAPMTLSEAKSQLQALLAAGADKVPGPLLASVLLAIVESQERIERAWAAVEPLQRDLPVRNLSGSPKP